MELEITIPSELSEITLAQYQKYAKLNFDDNAESSFLMHKTIEAFCNLKLENIAKIKYSDARSIVNHINKLFEPKQELIPTFKMHGVEFGFVPQLDDMTLGEYIDLDENFNDWENMHKAMAVLFRPVTQKKGERYTIEEYDSTKNIEVMKQMPLDVVMGAMFFFYNLNNELLQTTLNFLEEAAEKELTTQQLDSLEKSGVGFKASIRSLKEMFPNLGLSLN